jgi:microcystin-dependent protein
MSTPFMAEIRIFSFNFPPKNWAQCNGQILAIQQNQALFSLLGTTYGGNGVTTFALPNLQSRVPIHVGAGYVRGQAAGQENHTLIASEMPAHTHAVTASSAAGTSPTPGTRTWAASTAQSYSSASPNAAMNPAAVTNAGGSQPHNNMPPYSVLNFCIALSGVFPSRN